MSDPFTRTCPACGTYNRVPTRHLADAGSCGACKAPLPPVSEPIEVNEASFNEIIRQAPVPVLVDFWAEWCGPCRIAAPKVHALTREMAGKALVLKVDTEANPGLAVGYGLQGIPNFIIFRDGQVVFQRAGIASRTEMRRWLNLEGAHAA